MLLIAMTAAALLAVPASASASALTKSGGGLVSAGAQITAVGTGSTLEAEFGTVECGEEEVGAEVTVNNGSTVEAAGSGAGTECSLAGKAVKKTDVTGWSMQAASGSGTLSITYVMDYWFGQCHYEGTALPFTYTSGTNVIHVSGSIHGTPIFPCALTSVETATYALVDSVGNPTNLD